MGFQVIGMSKTGNRHTNHFGFRVTGDFAELLIDLGEAQIHVDVAHAYGRQFKDNLLMLFGLFAFGDVRDHTSEPQRRAIGGYASYPKDFNNTQRPVFAINMAFVVDTAPFAPRFGQGLFQIAPIIGMNYAREKIRGTENPILPASSKNFVSSIIFPIDAILRDVPIEHT